MVYAKVDIRVYSCNNIIAWYILSQHISYTMVYTMEYTYWSGIYHDATFQMSAYNKGTGTLPLSPTLARMT